MPNLWIEFGQIAVAHALAVASPGPDFALVLRQSLARGRRTAIWTSVGIGSGILVHVSYSLLGVGLLLEGSELAFTLLKIAGASYLAWLGWQALQAARQRTRKDPTLGTLPPREAAGQTAGRAWLAGFLTNALNPKAALFFLALFPTVVSPHTPKLILVGYGLWMAVATTAWFCLVSGAFAHQAARRTFLRWSHWIDGLLGVVFLGFAVSVLFFSVR